MSTQIPLTRGRVALIDDADLPLVSQYRWQYHRNGYAVTTLNRRKVYLHRMIMNAQPGQIVDHLDRNPLNNTRANLRFVTAQQNGQNRRKTSRCTTGFKGVGYERGKWRARIRANDQNIHLGLYNDLKTAALVYDCAARRLFGHFAYTNLPADKVTPEIESLVERILNPAPPIEKRPSQYRGVYWERGRWRAKIGVNGGKLHLGYFKDEVEAAKVYDHHAKLLHGAKAKLNFPKE